MSKVLKNIVTTIDGEEIGSLIINWDMNYWYETPSETHPDNPSQLQEQCREVSCINNIHFLLFNSVDISMKDYINQKILKIVHNKLLDAIEDLTIADLMEREVEYAGN